MYKNYNIVVIKIEKTKWVYSSVNKTDRYYKSLESLLHEIQKEDFKDIDKRVIDGFIDKLIDTYTNRHISTFKLFTAKDRKFIKKLADKRIPEKIKEELKIVG